MDAPLRPAAATGRSPARSASSATAATTSTTAPTALSIPVVQRRAVTGHFAGAEWGALLLTTNGAANIQLYQIDPQSFTLIKIAECHLGANLHGLERLRIGMSPKDYILAALEGGAILILEYNPKTVHFELIDSERYQSTHHPWLIWGRNMTRDWRSRCVLIGNVEDCKIVYILVDPVETKLSVSLPMVDAIPGAVLYSVVSVEMAWRNPVFACLEAYLPASKSGRPPSLHLDNAATSAASREEAIMTGEKMLVYFELDLEQNQAFRRWDQRVDVSANMVIPVPGDAGGVLVCSRNQVVWMHERRTPQQVPIPRHPSLDLDADVYLVSSTTVRLGSTGSTDSVGGATGTGTGSGGAAMILVQSIFGDVYQIEFADHVLTIKFFDAIPQSEQLFLLSNRFLLACSLFEYPRVYYLLSVTDDDDPDQPRYSALDKTDKEDAYFRPRPLRHLTSTLYLAQSGVPNTAAAGGPAPRRAPSSATSPAMRTGSSAPDPATAVGYYRGSSLHARTPPASYAAANGRASPPTVYASAGSPPFTHQQPLLTPPPGYGFAPSPPPAYAVVQSGGGAGYAYQQGQQPQRAATSSGAYARQRQPNGAVAYAPPQHRHSMLANPNAGARPVQVQGQGQGYGVGGMQQQQQQQQQAPPGYYRVPGGRPQAQPWPQQQQQQVVPHPQSHPQYGYPQSQPHAAQAPPGAAMSSRQSSLAYRQQVFEGARTASVRRPRSQIVHHTPPVSAVPPRMVQADLLAKRQSSLRRTSPPRVDRNGSGSGVVSPPPPTQDMVTPPPMHSNDSGTAPVVAGGGGRAESPVASVADSGVVPSEEPPATAAPSPAVSVDDAKLRKAMELRMYIVNEVYETEQSYAELLAIMEDKIRKPIEDQKLAPAVFCRMVFYGIAELRLFAKQFLDDLAALLANWDDSSQLGPLFLAHRDDFAVFHKFVDNYANALSMVRRGEEANPAFRAFNERCKSSRDTHRQSVQDYLILPIQRATRYPLLLKDVRKHTPEDHPDYPVLTMALEMMNEMAAQVNHVKQHEEEMTRMFTMFKQVEGCPPNVIKYTRRVILEAEVADVSSGLVSLVGMGMGMGGALKPTYRLFLLSDLLLLAKVHKKKMKFVRLLDLADIDFTEEPRGLVCSLTIKPESMSSQSLTLVNKHQGESGSVLQLHYAFAFHDDKARHGFTLAITSKIRATAEQRAKEGGVFSLPRTLTKAPAAATTASTDNEATPPTTPVGAVPHVSSPLAQAPLTVDVVATDDAASTAAGKAHRPVSLTLPALSIASASSRPMSGAPVLPLSIPVPGSGGPTGRPEITTPVVARSPRLAPPDADDEDVWPTLPMIATSPRSSTMSAVAGATRIALVPASPGPNRRTSLIVLTGGNSSESSASECDDDEDYEDAEEELGDGEDDGEVRDKGMSVLSARVGSADRCRVSLGDDVETAFSYLDMNDEEVLPVPPPTAADGDDEYAQFPEELASAPLPPPIPSVDLDMPREASPEMIRDGSPTPTIVARSLDMEIGAELSDAPEAATRNRRSFTMPRASTDLEAAAAAAVAATTVPVPPVPATAAAATTASPSAIPRQHPMLRKAASFRQLTRSDTALTTSIRLLFSSSSSAEDRPPHPLAASAPTSRHASQDMDGAASPETLTPTPASSNGSLSSRLRSGKLLRRAASPADPEAVAAATPRVIVSPAASPPPTPPPPPPPASSAAAAVAGKSVSGRGKHRRGASDASLAAPGEGEAGMKPPGTARKMSWTAAFGIKRGKSASSVAD
ncbi:pre-mRNA-splicing factor rse1 [Allomyces arbusculus]|nr:pre-mRNA-splicing factor rse1 [Allomyces arbusculus]